MVSWHIVFAHHRGNTSVKSLLVFLQVHRLTLSTSLSPSPFLQVYSLHPFYKLIPFTLSTIFIPFTVSTSLSPSPFLQVHPLHPFCKLIPVTISTNLSLHPFYKFIPSPFLQVNPLTLFTSMSLHPFYKFIPSPFLQVNPLTLSTSSYPITENVHRGATTGNDAICYF